MLLLFSANAPVLVSAIDTAAAHNKREDTFLTFIPSPFVIGAMLVVDAMSSGLVALNAFVLR